MAMNMVVVDRERKSSSFRNLKTSSNLKQILLRWTEIMIRKFINTFSSDVSVNKSVSFVL